jgi:hypothetical protein
MPTVSREELYKQVWERPLMKVAADYNITGTGLKKICERHEIPTPERGHWAKLEHGKPVSHPPLPDVSDKLLAEVSIMGSIYPNLPKHVAEAKARVRERLEEAAAEEATPPAASGLTADEAAANVPALAATLRAIRKARPDGEGFVSAKGRGILPLKVGPAGIDRSVTLLAHFFTLSGTQGYRPEATDEGLALLVEGEPVEFALEAPADRAPHQPTPAELKEQARYAGWGMARDPWPKYDHFPSERLSIVIQANAYSGLRRTFSDRQSKSLEQMLPRILEAFAEHAAFAKNRRHEKEESARRRQEAERLRRLDEAFGAREKRRIEFIEAVHEQLIERKKLEDVLAHLDSSADTENPSIEMIAWLRRRIRQLDALVSPVFLELSARSAKVAFVEPQATTDDERYAYCPPVSLQYWSTDEAAGQAHSRSALECIKEIGLLTSTE